MAPFMKKTYSRKVDDSYVVTDKENVDPFDELLLSPLKNEVQFQPLSFWNEKVENLGSQKNFNSRNRLYEYTDSDDAYSPNKKKRKVYKYLEGTTKKLHSRPKNQNACNNHEKGIPVRKVKYVKANSWAKESRKTNSKINDNSFRFVTDRKHYGKKGLSDPCSFFNISKCKEVNTLFTSIVENNEKDVFVDVKPYNQFVSIDEEKTNKRSGKNASNFVFKNTSQTTADCDLVSQSTFSPSRNVLGETYIVKTIEDSKTSVNGLFENRDETEDGFYSSELEDGNSITFLSETVDSLGDSKSNFSSESQDATLLSNTLKHNSTKEESTLCHSPLLFKGNYTLFEGSQGKTVTLSGSIPENNVSALTAMMNDMKISVASKKKLSEENISRLGKNSQQRSSFQYVNVRKRNKRCSRSTLKGCLNEQDTSNMEKTLKILYEGKRLTEFSSHSVAVEKPGIMETRNPLEESKILPEFSFNCTQDLINSTSDMTLRFAPPIFESTRVFEDNFEDLPKSENQFKQSDSFEETRTYFENSVILKQGKKWMRSMSVLKQIQNGTIFAQDSSRIKGRKYETFVQNMLQMQPDDSAFSTVVSSRTLSNETIKNSQEVRDKESPLSKKSLVFESFNSSNKGSPRISSRTSEKTFMNHTVKVVSDVSAEEPSAFKSALGLDCSNSVAGDGFAYCRSSNVSPKDFILALCGQIEVLPFEEYFNERTLKNCKKIGEGVYGEVFLCNSDTVIKIIPVEGNDKVNGEPQKKFEEILSEVVIASKLSNLRHGDKNRTSGFSEMKRCWCVVGKYPKYLLKLWNEYDQSGSGSENDSPVMFKSDQLYIILELANGGKDLESYVFNSSDQSLSIFIQTAFSLAAAERAFQFEHRDLHWGNLLIAPTTDKFMKVVLDDLTYDIPTKGVKVTIIDYTLSRISHEGCAIFNDLSVDPGLFVSQGDYQFEIYRMMRKAVKDNWSEFLPKTNIYWMHYTLDKMLKMVRYKNKQSSVHKKSLKKLKGIETTILEYEDSFEFVLSQQLI